jgi:hypothetical protein
MVYIKKCDIDFYETAALHTVWLKRAQAVCPPLSKGEGAILESAELLVENKKLNHSALKVQRFKK